MTQVPAFHAEVLGSGDGFLTLGEGPVWDVAAGRLRWVDIQAGIVFEGVLGEGGLSVTGRRAFGQTTGAVLPAEDGGFVVAGARHVLVLDPEWAQTRSIRLIADDVDSRLNDAVCDPAGRLLVGSLALDGREGAASVWWLDGDGRVFLLVDGLTLANGMGFSPDGGTLYLVDSIPGIVHGFDYDVATGRVGARRVVWRGAGLIPDGMTVDNGGDLWVAFFGAGQVRRISPAGEVLGIVEVAAPNTTCPAFAGQNGDRLVVATAREQLTPAQLEEFPASGSLFVADVGVTGPPATPWGGSTVGQTGVHDTTATEET